MFKFRLQRVLQWKQGVEQERATELAAAQAAREAVRVRRQALEGAREEGMYSAAAAVAHSPTVGELRNLRLLVDRLNDEVERAHEEADAADRVVQERMADYTTAFQERKVLDRLREKSQESWALDEAEADRRLMDTIALNGFVQRTAAEAAANQKENA